MSAVNRSTRRLDLGAVARAGAIAAVVSAVLNVIVARIGAALVDAPDSFVPLQVPAVVISTLVGILGGVVIYALLVRTGRDVDRLFPRIVWVLAVLTLLQPLSLLLMDNPIAEPDEPAAVADALVTGFLHLIPAAVITTVFSRLGRASAP